MEGKKTEILALGEPLAEFSATKEGGLGVVNEFAFGFGGDASNFVVAASRAGGRSGIITRLGNDRFGDAFMDFWEREGVDARNVLRAEDGPTGLYITFRDRGSHEFTYYRAGSAASRMTPDHLPVQAIRQADLLHVTGITQGISSDSRDTAFAAMDLAKRAGTLVSYDPNYRPALWPAEQATEVIKASVSRADLLFPSMEETELIFGPMAPEDAAGKYLELGAGIVALKLGPDGALVAGKDGMMRIPPIRVETKDASGAGDTFAGAFAAAFMEGRPLDWCARFAITASGLSTTGIGCVSPIPLRKDILSRMEAGEE